MLKPLMSVELQMFTISVFKLELEEELEKCSCKKWKRCGRKNFLFPFSKKCYIYTKLKN